MAALRPQPAAAPAALQLQQTGTKNISSFCNPNNKYNDFSNYLTSTMIGPKWSNLIRCIIMYLCKIPSIDGSGEKLIKSLIPYEKEINKYLEYFEISDNSKVLCQNIKSFHRKYETVIETMFRGKENNILQSHELLSLTVIFVAFIVEFDRLSKSGQSTFAGSGDFFTSLLESKDGYSISDQGWREHNNMITSHVMSRLEDFTEAIYGLDCS